MRSSIFGNNLACILLTGIATFSGCTTPFLKSESSQFSTALSDSILTTQPNSDRLPRRTTAEVCSKTAQQMESKGHIAEAIQLYLRAIEQGDQSHRTHHRLGVLYATTKDTTSAKKHFELAIESNPSDVALKNDYGVFCMSQGETDRAEAFLKLVVQRQPKNARAVNNLSKLYVQTNRSDLAFELMEKLHGPAVAHSNLGVMLAKQGDKAKAQEHLRKASELSKDLKTPTAFLSHLANNSNEQAINSQQAGP